MARIDGVLFGYREFSVKKTDIPTFLNALLTLGISAKIKNSRAQVRLSDAKRLREYLKGKIDFAESEICGLPGFFIKTAKDTPRF